MRMSTVYCDGCNCLVGYRHVTGAFHEGVYCIPCGETKQNDDEDD